QETPRNFSKKIQETRPVNFISKSRLLGSLISINGEKITCGGALNLEYCRIPDHGKINKKK
ncbi:MAG: hypothetical protein ACTSRH_06180, partial [Promethearchaeota archaeon]